MKKENKYLKLCNNPAEKEAKRTMKKAFFLSIAFAIFVAIAGVIIVLVMNN